MLPLVIDDRDRPEALAPVLGSFWTDDYAGRAQVIALSRATLRPYRQSRDDLANTTACLTPGTTPVFRIDRWRQVRILESTLFSTPATFGSTSAGAFGSGLLFGFAPVTVGPSNPTELVGAPYLLDRPLFAGRALVRDLDYAIDDKGMITFAVNPFLDPKLVPTPVYNTQGLAIDRALDLWAFRAARDLADLYVQHGYVLGIRQPSSCAYRDLLVAVRAAIVAGGTAQTLAKVLSAICGTPLAKTNETVLTVTSDSRGPLVITDQTVYRLAPRATCLVTVGQVLAEGDPICDGLRIDDCATGAIPTGLKALNVPVGPIGLDRRYVPFAFDNRPAPLQVTTAPDGHTQVAFGLSGTNADTHDFWAEVDARGVASGTTLAHLLDLRTSPIGEPSAASLPPTINPLGFLLANFLRGAVSIVRIRVGSLAANHLDLSLLRLIRRLVPPHTWVLLSLEMPPIADSRTIIGAAATLSMRRAGKRLYDTSHSAPTDGPIALYASTT
jgi:hypothetical protein